VWVRGVGKRRVRGGQTSWHPWAQRYLVNEVACWAFTGSQCGPSCGCDAPSGFAGKINRWGAAARLPHMESPIAIAYNDLQILPTASTSQL
jgi:hypothetical protein